MVGSARVSCADQKKDLVRKKERLEAHLSTDPDSLVRTDLGNGLNFKKRGLTKFLALVMTTNVGKGLLLHAFLPSDPKPNHIK